MKTSIQITEDMRKGIQVAQDRYGITMAGIVKMAVMQYLRREKL